jgi:hypothetical protein
MPQQLNATSLLSSVSVPALTSVASPEAAEDELPALPSIQPGRYRHYKGGEYEVLGVVRHSETLDPLVLYRPLHNHSGMWVRPYGMFLEKVEVNGAQVPRFALLPDAART